MQRKPRTTTMRLCFEDALQLATRPLSPLQRMVADALRRANRVPTWQRRGRR